MIFKEIIPGEQLRSYVKYYFLFESDADVEFSDTVFPGGLVEMVFNLGNGIWQSSVNGVYRTTPPVELWGQLTQPLAVKSKGKQTMLGIRFFEHAPAYFLDDPVWKFNNQILDLRDLLGSSVGTLHARLVETPDLEPRIALVENFLLRCLLTKEKRARKAGLVDQIVTDMKKNTGSTIESMASRYGLTPRYLQKLFLQSTGITPKLYSKINRFQRSLICLSQKNMSLTTIAYHCGYFDQSHFIRDFKSFTGITPSAYLPEYSPLNQAFIK